MTGSKHNANRTNAEPRFEARHSVPQGAVLVSRKPLAYAPASSTQLNHDRLPALNEMADMQLAFRADEDERLRRAYLLTSIAWIPVGLLFLILATLSLTRLLPFEYAAGMAGLVTLIWLVMGTITRQISARNVIRAFVIPIGVVIRRHASPVLPDRSGLAALPDSSIGAGGVSSPERLRSLKRVISSLLSSSQRASAPPVCARTTRHCLAADFARLEAGFYLEHTPLLRRLNHLTDLLERASGTGHHPGGRRGSQVSGGLRVDGHVASRCDPAGSCRVSALPQRHSLPSR